MKVIDNKGGRWFERGAILGNRIHSMSYPFSNFGRHLGCGSGIGELMDDLGHALASGGPGLKMLGGGQPARIPEINASFVQPSIKKFYIVLQDF